MARPEEQPTEITMPQPEELEKPLDTFHLFPQLPIELRYLIWQLTIPPPRIITVSTIPSRSGDTLPVYQFQIDRHDGAGKVPALGFTKFHEVTNWAGFDPSGFIASDQRVNPPPPIAFSICKESRQAVALFYDSCFKTYINPSCTVVQRISSGRPGRPPMSIVSHGRLMWRGVSFRPIEDVIHLSDDVWYVLFDARSAELQTANIRRLAISINRFKTLIRLFQYRKRIFGNVVHLILEADGRPRTDSSWQKYTKHARAWVLKTTKEYLERFPGTDFPSFVWMCKSKLLDCAKDDASLLQSWPRDFILLCKKMLYKDKKDLLFE